MKGPRKTTIRDIAERCHVSTATVSRAINHKHGVSDSLRTVILTCAKEIGYTPDVIARSMRSPRLDRVCIVAPRDANGETIFHLPTRESLESMVEADLRYHTFPLTHDLVDELQDLEATHPQLFVIVGPCLVEDTSRFESLHTPLLFVISDDAPSGYPSVNSDDVQGAETAVESLIDAGHTRITVLTDTTGRSRTNFSRRIQGYRTALERHDLTYDPTLIYPLTVDFDHYFSSSEEAIREQVLPKLQSNSLLSPSAPTAMFVLSDFLAMTLIRVLWNSGISIPNQLSIVSFGGWVVTQYIPVSLQTWAQPVDDLVAATGAAISALLRSQPFPDGLPLPTTHPDGTHGVAIAVSQTEYRVPGYLRTGQSVAEIGSVNQSATLVKN